MQGRRVPTLNTLSCDGQCHVFPSVLTNPLPLLLSHSPLSYTWQVPERGQSPRQLSTMGYVSCRGPEHPKEAAARHAVSATNRAQLSLQCEDRPTGILHSPEPQGKGDASAQRQGPAAWALWLVGTSAAQNRDNSLQPSWALALHLSRRAAWQLPLREKQCFILTWNHVCSLPVETCFSSWGFTGCEWMALHLWALHPGLIDDNSVHRELTPASSIETTLPGPLSHRKKISMCPSPPSLSEQVIKSIKGKYHCLITFLIYTNIICQEIISSMKEIGKAT